MAEVSVSDPSAQPLAGRYRLDRLIATGGMAQVWQATDEVLARKVAVKLLHPHLAADASFVTRFRAEAVAAARLTHQSIVSIYDTCSDGGREAIVMELVPGITLRRHLNERGPLDPPEAVGIATQVASALDAAHRGGLVHRDVKPANILICGDGRVKVADFGIAKAVDSDITATGTTLGTVKYLAPEQVEGGPVDARTDVYALGVVIYEMLCGRVPFVADTDAATALARLHQDPPRPRQVRASVPRALEDVVLKAIARQPADRYADAAELNTALLAAAQGHVTSPVPSLDPGDEDLTIVEPAPQVDDTPTGAAPSFRETERSWFWPTSVIVLLALAIGVAGILFSRTDAGRRLLGRDGNATSSTTSSIVPLAFTEARAFDPPPGGGEESNRALPNAIDGDPATEWTTEGYASRKLGGLKAGVGLIVVLNDRAELDQLTVTSPTNDWAASVYVADAPGATLAAWGEPVAEASGIAGDGTFDLGGKQGRAILLWITDLGDGPPNVRLTVGEVSVTRR